MRERERGVVNIESASQIALRGIAVGLDRERGCQPGVYIYSAKTANLEESAGQLLYIIRNKWKKW